MRRLGLGHAEGGQAPGAVLVTEHAQPARLLAGSACDDDLLGDQAVRNAQPVCRVGDADIDAVLGRAVKTPLLQPDRQPGAAARGVDDEIGRYRLTGVRLHAGHLLPDGVEYRLGDPGVHDVDVGDRRRSAPDLPFQLRAARHIRRELVSQPVRRTEDVAGGAEVDAVRPVLQNRNARGDHVVEQTREVRVELLGAARHQQVDVPALRHRRAVGRTVGKVVAFEHRDPVVEIRQHPRGAHARDARPDDHRMFASPPHCRDSTPGAVLRFSAISPVGIRYSPNRPGRMTDGLANQIGGAVDRGYRRAGDPIAQRSELVGSHRLRGVGRDRCRHLHHHRLHRGQYHRPRDRVVLRDRRDRVRPCRAVLRRVRLHAAGGGQRLHVLLRDVRRVHRLDHRLGSDPGVRGGRGRRRQRLVELSRHGVQLRRRHNGIRRSPTGLGRAADHRLRDRDLGVGHQAVGQSEPGDHRDQSLGRAAGGRGRGVLHQVRELHAVHPARASQVAAAAPNSRCCH